MFTSLLMKKEGINRMRDNGICLDSTFTMINGTGFLSLSFFFPFLCLCLLTVCLISLLTDMSMVQINFIFNLGESGARDGSSIALV